jgi:Pyridoxamine 5'-phosphate oxidase
VADLEPTTVRNLDRYGNPVLPWSRARDALVNGPQGPLVGFFLGTVGQDGRPHAAGIGVVWYDGDIYFTSGPGTRKSRNLATNPACTIAVKLTDVDLTLSGEAHRLTDPDTLERLAGVYRDIGWPAQVAGDAFTAPYSAPSAGPPPWHVYRFTFHTAIGLSTVEPGGATRWQFDRTA